MSDHSGPSKVPGMSNVEIARTNKALKSSYRNSGTASSDDQVLWLAPSVVASLRRSGCRMVSAASGTASDVE